MVKNYTKLILAGLVAIALVFSAEAGTKFSVGNLKYETLDGGGCAVTGQDNEIKGELVIPNKVVYAGSEYNVVRVANYAFQNNTTITSVVFSGEMKEIGYCSFEYANVASVTLTGVQELEAYAFSGCPIEELVIPASVRSIGGNSFNCSTLKTLKFEDGTETLEVSDGRGSFNCESLENLYFGRPFNESGGNFRPTETKNLNTITFGESVTFVPSSFANYGSALTQINFGGNETEIGNYAFQGCAALPQVVLPESCKHVGYCAFENCSSLNDITLTKVETFGGYAFSGCSPTDLFIPASVKVIENNSFNCSTIVDLRFEDSWVPIEIKDGWGSFNCTSLETLYFGRPFNASGENFRPYNTENLTTITFGEAVTFIPGSFANNGSALTQINFGGNETEIGNYAFQGCAALGQVVLPDACKGVGYCAFENCSSLNDITLTKVETFGAYAFSGCSPTDLFIPASVKVIESNSFNCSTIVDLRFEDSYEPIEIKDGWGSFNFTNLMVLYYGRPFNESGGNLRPYEAPYFGVVDFGPAVTFIPSSFAYKSSLINVHFSGNETEIGNYAFQNCEDLLAVHLPKTCKHVGYCAFEGCKSVSTISLNQVEILDAYAFSGCSPTQLIIPESVRSIENNSFNCPSIEELIFKDSEDPLEIKDGWSSFNNTSLVSLYYGRPFNETGGNYKVNGAENLQTIRIGQAAKFIPNSFATGCKSLTKIRFGGNEQLLDSYCFQKCEALEEVTLPEACETVGYCSFESCSALSSVHMSSTVKEIGSYAFAGTSLTSIACPAQEPPTISAENSFSDFAYKNATVYVPEGCYNAYAQAPYWKKFFTIDASGIQDIVADNIDFEMVGNQLYLKGQSHVSVYTINGKLVYSGRGNTITLPSGLYIISSNRHSAKVLSK